MIVCALPGVPIYTCELRGLADDEEAPSTLSTFKMMITASDADHIKCGRRATKAQWDQLNDPDRAFGIPSVRRGLARERLIGAQPRLPINAGSERSLLRSGRPWTSSLGPHVRFRRVQTLVREGSPLVKLRNPALERASAAISQHHRHRSPDRCLPTGSSKDLDTAKAEFKAAWEGRPGRSSWRRPTGT